MPISSRVADIIKRYGGENKENVDVSANSPRKRTLGLPRRQLPPLGSKENVEVLANLPRQRTLGLPRRQLTAAGSTTAGQDGGVLLDKRRFNAPRQMQEKRQKVENQTSLFRDSRSPILGGNHGVSKPVASGEVWKDGVDIDGRKTLNSVLPSSKAPNTLSEAGKAGVQTLFGGFENKPVESHVQDLSGNFKGFGRQSRVEAQAAPVDQPGVAMKFDPLQEVREKPRFHSWNSRLPPTSPQQMERVCAPHHVGYMDAKQEVSGEPLFQLASGKHLKVSAAGKARAEALLQCEPEDVTAVQSMLESTEKSRLPAAARQQNSPPKGQSENLGQPLFQFASGKHVKSSAAGKARAEALLRDEPGSATEVQPMYELREKSQWNSRLPLVARHQNSPQSSYDGCMDVEQGHSGQPLFQLASGKHVKTLAAAKARAEALLQEEPGEATGVHHMHEQRDKSQWSPRLPLAAWQQNSLPQSHGGMDCRHENWGQTLLQSASGKHIEASAAGEARAKALLWDEPGNATEVHSMHESREKSQWSSRLPLAARQHNSLQSSHDGCMDVEQGHSGQLLFELASGKCMKTSATGNGQADPLFRDEPVNSIEVHPTPELREKPQWNSRLPPTAGQQLERVYSPQTSHVGCMDAKHEGFGEPLFQLASGKQIKASAAGKARAEALLRDEPDDCTAVQPMAESGEKSQWSYGLPLASRQETVIVPSPQTSHDGGMDFGQENLGQTLFQFASGKHIKASAAGKAKAEALLGDKSDEANEVHSLQESKEKPKFHQWSSRLPLSARNRR